ncbi:MAG TPA: SDR family oxidoreductase [Baekduia sp.]|nr:SDR family oxidoreductase [Baekduia sp.]
MTNDKDIMRFDNKTAIVTGGSRGIGRGIVERLAREGAEVLIDGRDATALTLAVKELRAEGLNVSSMAGDVTQDGHIEALVARALDAWGRIDILCNNAAFSDPGTVLDLSRQQWDRVLAVALTAPFFLSQAVARHMVEAGRGVILNVSSVAAHGADDNVNYAAAKSALLSVTRDFAKELGPKGVRCVAISPGWVDTPMVAEHTPPEMLRTLREGFTRVPLRRLITIDEVTALCAFAASDEASAITGCELLVDGGMVADLHVLPTLA